MHYLHFTDGSCGTKRSDLVKVTQDPYSNGKFSLWCQIPLKKGYHLIEFPRHVCKEGKRDKQANKYINKK